MSQESHEKKFIKDNNIKLVKHFKRELDDPNTLDHLYVYQNVATHSETKEKYVVYSSLADDSQVWIRPYDMFMSEVDHEKYPETKQKYRFEILTTEERVNLRQALIKELNSKDETKLTAAINSLLYV